MSQIREMLLDQLILMRQNPSKENTQKAALLMQAVAVFINSIKVEKE